MCNPQMLSTRDESSSRRCYQQAVSKLLNSGSSQAIAPNAGRFHFICRSLGEIINILLPGGKPPDFHSLTSASLAHVGMCVTCWDCILMILFILSRGLPQTKKALCSPTVEKVSKVDSLPWSVNTAYFSQLCC